MRVYLEQKSPDWFPVSKIRMIKQICVDYARVNGVRYNGQLFPFEQPRQALGKQQLGKFTLRVSLAGQKVYSAK